MLLKYFLKVPRQCFWQGHGPEPTEAEQTLTGVKHCLGSDSWFGFYSLPLCFTQRCDDLLPYSDLLDIFSLSLLSAGYILLLDFLIHLERHCLIMSAFFLHRSLNESSFSTSSLLCVPHPTSFGSYVRATCFLCFACVNRIF